MCKEGMDGVEWHRMALKRGVSWLPGWLKDIDWMCLHTENAFISITENQILPIDIASLFAL